MPHIDLRYKFSVQNYQLVIPDTKHKIAKKKIKKKSRDMWPATARSSFKIKIKLYYDLSRHYYIKSTPDTLQHERRILKNRIASVC